MVEVILTDEAAGWYDSLDVVDQERAMKAIDLLEHMGIGLRFPHSSEIKSSRIAMRELRVGGSPLRMLYAFDPLRNAVVLLGGDKSGNEKRWYVENVPRAEQIWVQYQEEQGFRKK